MTPDPTLSEPGGPSEYVGRQDAAAILGITTRQIDRLVAAKKITKYRRPIGRFKVSYRRADLTALLKQAAAEHPLSATLTEND